MSLRIAAASPPSPAINPLGGSAVVGCASIANEAGKTFLGNFVASFSSGTYGAARIR